MNCPNCHTPLHLTERLGVEIDYCQTCRGAWLDRGELDKILEKATVENDPHKPGYIPQTIPAAPPPSYERDRRVDDDDYDEDRSKRKRKRESFLSDLFDF